MKKCNNCGVEQPEEALFCEECGVRLENGDEIAAVLISEEKINETPEPMQDVSTDGIPGPMPESTTGSREELVSEPIQGSFQETTKEVENEPAEEKSGERVGVAILPPTDRFAPVSQTVNRSERPEVGRQPVSGKTLQSQPAEQFSTEQQSTEQPSAEQLSVEQLLNDAQPKKVAQSNKKSLKIGIIVVCLILIIVGIISVIMINSNSGTNNRRAGTSSTQTTGSGANSGSTGNNTGSRNGSASQKMATVVLSGWEFSIPEEYTYELQGSNLAIYGENEQWALKISYEDTDYSRLVNNLDSLMQRVKNSGYEITRYGINTFGGAEYYWFDVNVAATGDKGILALTQAPDGGTFKITLVDIDQAQDHTYLDSAAEILNTAATASDSN